MEKSNTNSTDERIIKFDKTLFSKSYLPYIGFSLIIGFGIYTLTSLSYFFTYYSFYFDYQLLVYILLLFIVFNIVTYAGMRRLANYNYFEIKSGNSLSFCLHKYGYAFKEQSTVQKIITLKRTPFSIIVRGSIEVVHLYYEGRPEPFIKKKKRLRIPAYFENMDEIYEALEKMKEQS